MRTEGKQLKRPDLETIKRFLKHVKQLKVGKKGCWLWTAYTRGDDEHKNSKYGQFYCGGQMMHAHRVSFAIFYGEVPKGFDVNHRCGRHNCVNPEHLDLMPRGANVADGNRKRNGKKDDEIPF